jgi:hypothetical protein
MTGQELAKALGISGAMVSRLLRRGMPSDSVEAAERWRKKKLEWTRTKTVRGGAPDSAPALPPAAPATQPDVPLRAPGAAADSEATARDEYWNSRSRREAAEAELAELELAERNGRVIQVAAVETVWAHALVATREHLLQVRARLSPLLAVEGDVFKIEQMLDAEHSQALSHMAGVQMPQPPSQ